MERVVVHALLSLAIAVACLSQPVPDYAAEARRINELAAADHIRTEQDARTYIDAAAQAFGGQHEWVTARLRRQLAHQEYLAVREGRLISDERLAVAVNDVLDATGAPPWSRMTAAEVRNYRDANFALINMPNVPIHLWRMPNVVARSASGGFAEGSRPVEALMLLYLLTALPENLVSTKDRARSGQLASVLIEEERKRRSGTYIAVPRSRIDFQHQQDPRVAEFTTAQRQYMQTHTAAEMDKNIFEAAKRLIFTTSE